jgi:hypothetical protein
MGWSGRVTSRLPDCISATAGVPQIAADLLQHHIFFRPNPEVIASIIRSARRDNRVQQFRDAVPNIFPC